MITFPRVPEVVPGDPIRAADFIALAEGANARIRSGLGDPTTRIAFYNVAMAQQIRNPSAEGLFPPQAEFDEFYKLINPAEAIWPTEPPGENEGANLASTLGAFVFGADAIGLESEDIRLAEPAAGGLELTPAGSTARDIWELGKLQRGAWDPATGEIASPAFTAARTHYQIIQSRVSPHGNAYGSFQPIPELLGDCGDSEIGPPAIAASLDWQVKFTSLKTPPDATLTWHSCPGTLGTEPDPALNVSGIYYGPEFYVVVFYDGHTLILLRSEWIEGPYTGGGYLRKTFGNHLPRVLNFFGDQFRGTAEQIADQLAGRSTWNNSGFDIQRFLTSQYLLSPVNGRSIGEGLVAPLYPIAQKGGGAAIPESTFLHFEDSSTTRTVATDNVCSGCMVFAQKLAGPTSVQFLVDGVVRSVANLVPDVDGNASQIIVIPAKPAGTVLSFRVATFTQFTEATSAAGIGAELLEQMEYKPLDHDLALTLRLGCARVETTATGVDGQGLDEDQARQFGESYFSTGTILNTTGAPGMSGSLAEINTNAVFEGARNISKDTTRLITRNQLLGYAVDAGKSVLWFKRLAFGLGHDITADSFGDIAPARDPIPSGSLLWGRTYRVSGGTGETVRYQDSIYGDGETFVGVKGKPDFDGLGLVYEVEGIRHDAEPQGWSNEWVLDLLSAIPYDTPEESLYKPGAFADYFWFFNRCLFDSPVRPDSGTWHFMYGQTPWLAPQAVTGYNYATLDGSQLNRKTCSEFDTDCIAARKAFYRSCRIYEPPVEIDSVTVSIEGGEEVVRVALTGRLHSHVDAPASIDRDFGTWDVTALKAEVVSGDTSAPGYRTAENAIRLYLVQQYIGGECAVADRGDNAVNSDIAFDPDKPHGSCFPRFLLTRLVPKPYAVTTDKSSGTPLLQDQYAVLEWMLRAMVEGCVDGHTSVQYGCEVGVASVFDYSFPKACFDAFGKQWLTSLPSVETAFIPAAQIRNDSPEGFGQLTNTITAAEIHNQFVRLVNLMTDYRVMLPMDFETLDRVDQVAIPAVDVIDTATETSLNWTSGTAKGYFSGTIPDPGAVDSGSWTGNTFAFSGHEGNVSESDASNSPQWTLFTQRTEQRYRYNFTDNDAREAVPETWRDMLDTDTQLLATVTTITGHTGKENVAPGSGSECNAFPDFWPTSGADVVLFHDQINPDFWTTEIRCGLVPSSGIISATPLAGTQILRVGRRFLGDGAACFGSVENSQDITPIPFEAVILQIPLA